jgi:hypothetical protein
MKIERTSVSSELEAFSDAGSGVVVGGAGVGKSHALIELSNVINNKGVPCLIVSVEQLGAATPDEIQSILGGKGDLIALLKGFETEVGTGGVVIFDGFDAARGIGDREGVLNLIRRVVFECRQRWRIIVSVRTFDAEKSKKLLECFPAIESSKSENTGIACRHYQVPGLSDSEIAQASDQIPGLCDLLDRCNADVRQMLRIPFNLWLVEKLLAKGVSPQRISGFTSEIQLLEALWIHRVRASRQSEDCEYFLKTIVGAMTQATSLRLRLHEVYKPDLRAAWEFLLSEEILQESDGVQKWLSFSHNLLFDYSASIYLLDVDIDRLNEILSQRVWNPFFLRPSLMYSFVSLWHSDSSRFWQSFRSILATDESHIRLVTQLVLPTVVVEETESLSDLDPLLDNLRTDSRFGVHAVSLVFQALRTRKPKHIGAWASFLPLIGNRLDRKFAWIGGLVAKEFVESENDQRSNVVTNCAEYCRSLLRWAWECRKGDTTGWFEKLASVLAIPVVSRTYWTAPTECRELLENVISAIGNGPFPIDCIYRLVNEVEYIVSEDPDFVGRIYVQVFGYEEENDSVTAFGGAVLPMRSNRRQDYDLCRYVLIQKYEKYLDACGIVAVQFGLRAVEGFVYRVGRFELGSLGDNSDVQKTEFSFLGGKIHLDAGLVGFFVSSSFPDKEYAVMDRVFDWAEESLLTNKLEVSEWLRVFSAEVRIPFFWARLLRMAAKSPDVLGTKVWELATIQILATNFVSDVAVFLENCFAKLRPDQRRKIEESIESLDQFFEPSRRGWLDGIRGRLVAGLPLDFVQLESTEQRIRSLQNSKEDSSTKLYQKTDMEWGRVSEEDFLTRQGVDPETTENKALMNLALPLREWFDSGKNRDAILRLIPVAYKAHKSVEANSNVDEAVMRSVASYVSTFAQFALIELKLPSSSGFEQMREVIIGACKSPFPKPDPDADRNWRIATWSLEPRNEAAAIIPWLLQVTGSDEIKELLVGLVNDPVPSVRFLIGERLWRLSDSYGDLLTEVVENFIELEGNGLVLQGVASSLARLIRGEEFGYTKLVGKLNQKLNHDKQGCSEARKTLTEAIIDSAVGHDCLWAQEIVEDWKRSGELEIELFSIYGHRLADYLKPRPDIDEKILQRATENLLSLFDWIENYSSKLESQFDATAIELDARTVGSLYSVFDRVVMQIFFSLDESSRLRKPDALPLDENDRKDFFEAMYPVLDRILEILSESRHLGLQAADAHYFMQLLNGVVEDFPSLALSMASRVVACSARLGYAVDSMAMEQVVKLVEVLLADFRGVLQMESSMKELLELLDVFVEVGWPEASNLVWRLDEVFR